MNLIDSTVKRIRMEYQGCYSNSRYATYAGQYMAMADILYYFFTVKENVPSPEATALRDQMYSDIIRMLEINDEKMKSRAPSNVMLASIAYALTTSMRIAFGDPLPKDEACVIEGKDAIFVRRLDLPKLVKTYSERMAMPCTSMSASNLAKQLDKAGANVYYPEGGEDRTGKRYDSVYGKVRLIEIPKHLLQDVLDDITL